MVGNLLPSKATINSPCNIGKVSQQDLWSVLQAVHDSGAEILEVTKPRPTLQDVFVRAIGEVQE